MQEVPKPKFQIPNRMVWNLELGAWDFLLLSSVQNAGGRSEMGQPTVYQKHSTLPSREDDV
jgi:hypothetical protein